MSYQTSRELPGLCTVKKRGWVASADTELAAALSTAVEVKFTRLLFTSVMTHDFTIVGGKLEVMSQIKAFMFPVLESRPNANRKVSSPLRNAKVLRFVPLYSLQ